MCVTGVCVCVCWGSLSLSLPVSLSLCAYLCAGALTCMSLSPVSECVCDTWLRMSCSSLRSSSCRDLRVRICTHAHTHIAHIHTYTHARSLLAPVYASQPLQHKHDKRGKAESCTHTSLCVCMYVRAYMYLCTCVCVCAPPHLVVLLLQCGAQRGELGASVHKLRSQRLALPLARARARRGLRGSRLRRVTARRLCFEMCAKVAGKVTLDARTHPHPHTHTRACPAIHHTHMQATVYACLLIRACYTRKHTMGTCMSHVYKQCTWCASSSVCLQCGSACVHAGSTCMAVFARSTHLVCE